MDDSAHVFLVSLDSRCQWWIVRMLERLRELEAEERDVLRWESMALVCVEDVPQVKPVDELERHIGSTRHLTEVDDPNDVAVTQLRRKPSLALKKRDEVLIVAKEGKHQL